MGYRWAWRDQVLESPEIQGNSRAEEQINPTRIPIEGKESFRWLQNMQQSSDLIAQPQRCIHIGDRESDIYELLPRLQTSRGGSWFERVPIDSSATEITPSATRWLMCGCKDFIVSNCGTLAVKLAKLSLRSDTAA
jgi:hypothetical protein